MKAINTGNKEVIDNQVKENLRRDLEVNHEYESGLGDSTINKVIKSTFQEMTDKS